MSTISKSAIKLKLKLVSLLLFDKYNSQLVSYVVYTYMLPYSNIFMLAISKINVDLNSVKMKNKLNKLNV